MKQFIQKSIALITATSLFAQSFVPNQVYALTGGPQSPEFSSFESVSTSQMVDPFSGDFTYNIPLLDVPGPNGGGYPISLSYHSGISPEDEASWVGYGWTLNPGAIIRNKRGLADDLYASKVTYYNKMPANTTLSLTATTDLSVRAFGIPSEFISQILGSVANGSVGVSNVLAYNNYKGVTLQTIPYVSYQLGLKNTTISIEPGSESLKEGARYSYSYTNPFMFMMSLYASTLEEACHQSSYYSSAAPLLNYISRNTSRIGSTSSSRLQSYSLHNNSFPSALTEYEGSSYSLSAGLYVSAIPIPLGVGASLQGSFVQQKNVNDGVTEKTAYGYLYSENAGKNDVMDFSVEKDEDFNLRDETLPIPFSSADDFSVVGEGISGVIRAYSSAPGEFHPAYVHSHVKMGSLGVHATVGPNQALSADVGAQVGDNEGQNISIGKWDDTNTNDSDKDGDNDDFDFENGTPEKYYFRFKGDMGGFTSFTSDDEVASATINGDAYKMSSLLYKNVNDGEGVSRSTFVGYHTNDQIQNDKDGSGKTYNRYSLRSDIESLATRSAGSDNLDKRIGEFEVTNKQGIRYVYGFPLYAKNEKEISFSVSGYDNDAHIVYANEEDADRVFGHEVKDRYASSYLLTEVTTPDYIDVNHNGPDEGDFGGWTKFNYAKQYGEGTSGSTYYHWRSPYRGLNFSAGEYSKTEDNLGSYQSGDREVAYVSSIETATHIAIFELNDPTTEPRYDGLGASDDATADNSSSTKNTSQRLRYLKSIKLYAKDENGDQGELMKTIHFKYDYSLMQNQPNSDGTGTSTGKLTLTKIYAEYANVHNTEIAPYIFEYAYPTDISYPAPFGNASETSDSLNIVDLYSQYTSGSNSQQNPNYDSDNMDIWGMYQKDGSSHYSNYFPWIEQNPSSSFDPAAWHLKRIKLPSSAEIHVQYEQDDYEYVQNRKAMVMASVTGTNDDSNSDGIGSYGVRYYLGNLDELGITSDEYDELEDYIREIFINQGQKMYFKFAYDVSAACGTAEYITGYANVMDVGIETSNSYHLNELYVRLGNPGTEQGIGSPCEACLQYYKANKGLKIVDSDACDNTLTTDESNPEGSILQLWGLDISDVVTTDGCQSMNLDGYSYLKIPLPHAKKGGGVRVKRLLTYDNGIESGNTDKRVFGQEFVYQNLDGTSSGVAANEPNREENALIGYLKKRSESTKDQILVSGEDKKQFEGPIGEYLLPGPSVGYARVVVKNIYSGTTNGGFSVSNFYTAKDYPFDWGNTNDDNYCGVRYSTLTTSKEENNSFGFFVNKVLADYKMAQGYRFVIANMHGKPKSSMQYDGEYENINNPTECSLLSSSEYNYFEPGEKIPVMTDYTSSDPKYSEQQLGKEAEVICFSKKVVETVEQSHTTIEGGVMMWVPLTIPYAIPFYFRTVDESYMRMHVTNQIIYFPTVIKSVTNYIDGTYRTLTNRYFDPKTGDVLVQEASGNYDQLVMDNNTTGHDGKYYTYSLPAHFYYDGMGQKSGSEGYSFSSDESGITITKIPYGDKDMIYFSGKSSVSDYADVLSNFADGDLIAMNMQGSSTKEIYNVTGIGTVDLIISPVSGFYSSSSSDNKEVEVTIIKSGKQNLLSASAGSYVAYGSEDAMISGSAVTYSDDWDMEDEMKEFYSADSDNQIETGEAGKWHAQNTYSFWDDVTRMDSDVDRNYEAGLLKNFTPFDWDDVSNNSSRWKNISTATSYTPNGSACEEKNMYDIYSTSKVGYGGNLAYLAAQNTQYNDVLFESFEFDYGNIERCNDDHCFEEMGIDDEDHTLTQDIAHTGDYSVEINNHGSATNFSSTLVLFEQKDRSEQIRDNGFIVKIWVKTSDEDISITLRDASAYTNDDKASDGDTDIISTASSFSETTFEEVARTGEWKLYQAVVNSSNWSDYPTVSKTSGTISTWSSNVSYGLQIYFSKTSLSGSPAVYIDDIRVQPLDAQMNCYVYDPATYKVLATLDDQNFAMLYQYNEEGQLIRKKKETIRGVKTWVETEYNLPTQNR